MHVPVLQKEIIDCLEPKPNKNFIDCTVNDGGHALGILEKTGPAGKLLGIDLDKEVIEGLKRKIQISRLDKRFIIACDNFANLNNIFQKSGLKRISGIMFDLGMSSWHLEESKRGFSFLKKEPLDMRYSADNPLTAEKILNYWPVSEIERMLQEYGEERFSRQIATKIVSLRKLKPVRATLQLVEIIRQSVPSWYQRQKIHFATKTFQALRIAVNDELGNIQKALPQALDILEKDGRVAVISFHSLEDRIVKNLFREKAKQNIIQILTKKPIMPAQEEININPRSRSARLRAAIKL